MRHPPDILPASAIITNIIALMKKQEDISIRELLGLLGERSIAFALLLFSLISSIPGIPGFAAFAGIPVAWLGVQLIMGHHNLWLPHRLLDYRITHGALVHKLEITVPYLQKIEMVAKPRWQAVSAAPLRNLLGLVFLVMGILVALPIPFTNLPLGLCLTLLSMGLIERDGLIIALAVIACIGVIAATSAAMLALWNQWL